MKKVDSAPVTVEEDYVHVIFTVDVLVLEGR